MKTKKYMAGGDVGLEEAMAEATSSGLGKIGEMGGLSGKGIGKSDKKKLPSEEISSESKIPRPNLTDRITDTVKGAGQRLKDKVMGTKKQNEEADANEKRRAEENPYGNEAKFRKAAGKGEFKSGGSVRSASSRADGCAIRGKTRA
jgi:hypothetical protein